MEEVEAKHQEAEAVRRRWVVVVEMEGPLVNREARASPENRKRLESPHQFHRQVRRDRKIRN